MEKHCRLSNVNLMNHYKKTRLLYLVFWTLCYTSCSGVNMGYTFRIYREVYEEMISGRKTIEIRLLNDKTEKIKAGDIIRFNVASWLRPLRRPT